jgi:hypothetical protein
MTMIALASSPLVIPTANRKDKTVTYPMTIALSSAHASREIALSVDDGVSYFVPIYDTTTAGQLVVVVTAPISAIRLTGSAGVDSWSIR